MGEVNIACVCNLIEWFLSVNFVENTVLHRHTWVVTTDFTNFISNNENQNALRKYHSTDCALGLLSPFSSDCPCLHISLSPFQVVFP